MIATYLIRCNALSRRSMKTVTVLFFVAILAMIEIHQSRKQTNDIPIYSEEANGLSNFHVIVTTSNQSYINAHSEYVLPTNAEDKKNQIPTTPKNNRSSSLSFEYDIDIVSPEHTRAMILRSVFRKVSKSKQLFHLIHTTNEGNFGTMQKRCLESIFYHHPDAKVLLHVRKMSDKPVRYLRNAGYDLQTRSYDPVKSLKRLQRQRIVPRHILNAFMNRVDEYESDSQGYWFSNESNLQRMILMYIDGGIYLDTDTIVVRAMDDLPLNTIGFQDKSQKALNGAVLKFEPKNGFMRASLQEFLHNFNNRYWGANGPELLTRVFFSSPESWNLTTVSPYFFQYFSFQRIKQDCYQDVRDYKVLHRMNGIRSKAYVVHLNNQLAVTIVNGSTCDCLENTFCISETCSLKDRCRPLLEKPMQAPLTTGVDYLDKMVSTDMLSLPEDAYYSSRTSVAHQMSLKIFVYNLTDLPEYMQYDNSITLATQEALVKLFATFQGRTFNASVADFFIIPFVWASVSCANCTISNTHPKEVLQYYSMNPSRHLFFLPERSEYSAKIKSYSDTDIDKTISIDLPPFNPHPAFQPAAISHRSVTWWNKSRKYSLVASDVSGDDYNMSNTFHLFINHVKDWKTVGGLPFLLVHSTEVDLSDMVNYLQNSFFCPCFFEEDSASFQRFFDAILSGCIPVMPDYLMEKIEFLPFSSYIPYHEFVLEVNATTIGEGSMIEAIKNTIQNHTDLEHRQSRLREYAVTVSYGMGRDAHGFHDAFAQLVNTLEEKQAS